MSESWAKDGYADPMPGTLIMNERSESLPYNIVELAVSVVENGAIPQNVVVKYLQICINHCEDPPDVSYGFENVEYRRGQFPTWTPRVFLPPKGEGRQHR